MSWTREMLDQQGCSVANCEHDHSVIGLYAVCHSQAGLNVQYVKAEGVLEISCKGCGQPVATVKVAAQ
jgi:hypothetical protein